MTAPKSLGDFKPMRIGCDNVVCALLKNDKGILITSNDNLTGNMEWDTIFKLPGVQALNINPNMNIETAFYDDGPGEVATTLGNIEVSFDKSSLSSKEKAALLGKAIVELSSADTNEAKKANVVVSSSNDVPPWVAIGFRTMRGDGTYRYIWLLKGKFIDPADNNETKADTVNFQNEQLVGRFVKTDCSFQVTTVKVTDSGSTQIVGAKTNIEIKPWKTEMEASDLTGNNIAIQNKWFDQVVTPVTKIASQA